MSYTGHSFFFFFLEGGESYASAEDTVCVFKGLLTGEKNKSRMFV